LFYSDNGCLVDGYLVAFCCSYLECQYQYLFSLSGLPLLGGTIVAGDNWRYHL